MIVALWPHNPQEAVKSNNAHAGIALDGDADRIVLVDEREGGRW